MKFQICIAGKNEIAVKVLLFLLKEGFGEQLLVCPIRNDDGINRWQPSLKYFALRNNIPIISIQQAQQIEDLIFISLEYDCLIRPHLFRTSRLYNLHFSALPQYKGMYTSAIPILLGSRSSGVTIHEIDCGIDTGPIVSQLLFDIEDYWTARDLYFAYMSYGYLLFKQTFQVLISDIPPKSIPQASSSSSYFSKKYINYSHLSIDLYQTADQIVRQLRAFSFREYQIPVVHGLSIGSWTILDKRSYAAPGSIVEGCDDSLVICSIDYDLLLNKHDGWDWFFINEHSFIDDLDKSNIDNTDKDGFTPLMHAAQLGNFALCALLLNNGANPNKRDIIGRSSLAFAESCMDDQLRDQTIEILTNFGAHYGVIDNTN